MKIVFLIPLLACVVGTTTWAQARIYRCGNEYTNTVTEAQAKNCKLISGGNVTVVQAQKPASRPVGAAQPGQRVDSSDQRAKDSDSRLILESELKKAEILQMELLKEYNNGQPEKQGTEASNPQRYQDRVAQLKSGIARNERDIEGIRRELSRVPSAAASATSSSAK